MRESVTPTIYRPQPRRASHNRLKRFRRVATRCDKLAASCLAMVTLAATRLWARFESAT